LELGDWRDDDPHRRTPGRCSRSAHMSGKRPR
jgi:hypothetical protein